MRQIVEDFRRRMVDHPELTARWASVVGATSSSMRGRAVGANVLALLTWGTPDDVRALRQIVGTLGGPFTAETQESILAPLDTEERRPLTTAFVRRLEELAWRIPGQSRTAAADEVDDAEELRSVAGEAAVRLLMLDADADAEPPTITTAEDLVDLVRHGDLPAWRRLMIDTVENPWNGTGTRHLKLLAGERYRQEARILSGAIAVCRQLAEADERRTVANHIRRLIHRSGLTQREFAALLGTSPSRLSTYATGAVTPSATMLVRINRVAKRIRLAEDESSPA